MNLYLHVVTKNAPIRAIVSNRSLFQIIEEYITVGKSIQINLKGDSMLPFLRNGDQIELAPANIQDYKIGKVVLARWKGSYVLHRIIWKNKKHLFLSGDNNLFQIEKIMLASVIAGIRNASRQDRPIPILGLAPRMTGILWFLLRPARIIIHKLTLNIIKKQL